MSATTWNTFFLAVVLLGCNVYGQNKMAVPVMAEVVAVILKHFHSSCVSIVYRTGDTDMALSDFLILTQLEKLLIRLNLQSAVIDHESLDYNIHCRCNCPLYVMLEGTHTFHLARMTQKARWLLFLPDKSSIEDVIRGINIPIDCEFLVAQHRERVVTFSEVYRVHATSPLEIHGVGNWSLADGLHWTSGHILHRRCNLRGQLIAATFARACTSTTAKFVNNKPVEVGGYFGHVWSTLGEVLNFSTSFETQDYWGTRLDNGSWSGVIGSILRNESVIGLSASSITMQRHNAVDFLTPLLHGRTMMYIRHPGKFKSWSNFAEPFEWTLWLAITTCILLLAIGLWATGYLGQHYGCSEPFHYTLLESFQTIFSSFCSQGHDSTPKSWSCRIVYLTSYLVGVVILAAYSATLISFLAVKHTLMPFETLHEMLRDETYNLNVPSGVELFYFRYSLNSDVQDIYSKKIAPVEKSLPSYEEALERICTEPRYAIAMSSYYVESLQAAKRLNCAVTGVPQASFQEHLSMPIAKGCPYIRIINHNILKMKCTGIMSRLRDRYWYKLLEEDSVLNFKVSLNAATPVFMVFILGAGISLFVLAVELCVYKGFRGSKVREPTNAVR